MSLRTNVEMRTPAARIPKNTSADSEKEENMVEWLREVGSF